MSCSYCFVTPNAHRENPTEPCYILGDWWFWGSLDILIISLTARIFLEIWRLKDKIDMAKEMTRTASTWVIFFGECHHP